MVQIGHEDSKYIYTDSEGHAEVCVCVNSVLTVNAVFDPSALV